MYKLASSSDLGLRYGRRHVLLIHVGRLWHFIDQLIPHVLGQIGEHGLVHLAKETFRFFSFFFFFFCVSLATSPIQSTITVLNS